MSDKISDLEYKDLNIGDIASFDVTIDESMVDNFSKLSGDYNPLHMDETYALQTEFQSRVAHGMIVGALFSRLVGVHLPGKYCLYLSQNIKFHKPILIGSKITVEGKIEQKLDSLKVIKVRTVANSSEDKSLLVEGEAVIKLLK